MANSSSGDLFPTPASQPAPPESALAPELQPDSRPVSRLTRGLQLLRPSHRHTAYTATLLLMISAALSRVMGLVRVKYIALAFGSGMEADALNAAFVLPDMISYFLVGGAASITFVSILTRYRDTGREAEGERSLSVILSTMALVLGGAILVAEIAAPWFIGAWYPKFDPVKAALCTRLTRILLPAQMCFFAGGVFGAVLLVRKQFYAQAVTPLIYNLGTIVGGVLLVRSIGVSSLAIGTVGGAIAGPFLINAIGAYRAGVRYRPVLDWHDAGFREWVRLSIPLMVGVSLVTADNWIIAHFASTTSGGVSVMTYAKQLFTAPMAVLAQAAGAASMPFFAGLWAKQRRYDFAVEVANSVSRVAALGLLASSGMIALAAPLLDLVLSGGQFGAAAAAQTAVYFALFSVSLFLWSAQAIYARAFYAAGNTIVPMVAGTLITLISWPIYGLLYRFQGTTGLALASDVGIALQTLSLAVLLHRRRMVSLASLDYRELGRCLAAGVAAGTVVWGMAAGTGLLLQVHAAHGAAGLHASPGRWPARWVDAIELIAGSGLWLLVAGWVLEKTGSALPRATMRRLGLGRAASRSIAGS